MTFGIDDNHAIHYANFFKTTGFIRTNIWLIFINKKNMLMQIYIQYAAIPRDSEGPKPVMQ